MRNFVYLALIISGIGFTTVSKAQVNVSINIGSQPQWGPVGYNYARFYYMPEINAYYDVTHRRYTYFHGNRWVTKSKLPGRYRNVNLFRTYKVVMNDHNPWMHNRSHHRSYNRYAHNYAQAVLRDAPRHDRYDRNDYRRDDRRHKEGPKHHNKGNKGRGNGHGHRR